MGNDDEVSEMLRLRKELDPDAPDAVVVSREVRTCFSCAICELSVTKTCCDSGFCDQHYAMHTEVAARFHHGITSELLRTARMALQQFEFTYGKRKRGRDAAFLMDELRTAITNAEVEVLFAKTDGEQQ